MLGNHNVQVTIFWKECVTDSAKFTTEASYVHSFLWFRKVMRHSKMHS